MSDRNRLASRMSSEVRYLTSDIRPLSFAGLVVLAGSLNPIPSRTRPSKSPAPMVLSLKTWKSRSLPGLPRTETLRRFTFFKQKPRGFPRGFFAFAGDGRLRLGHAEPFQFVDDFRERTA